MADLEQLLHMSNVCQIVTDEDIRTLEGIKERLGILSLQHSNVTSKQVRFLQRAGWQCCGTLIRDHHQIMAMPQQIGIPCSMVVLTCESSNLAI